MNCHDSTLLTSLKGCLERWAPPPKLTISEWADRYRVLSPEASAEPGTWSTDRAPYQRGIMDAMSDPLIEEVTFVKSSQVGATEMINNAIGYFVHQDPSPILLIMPTKEVAGAWSKDRLATMLRDTPVIRGRVRDVKSRDSDNTILHKRFFGGHITIGGANAPAGLASRPVRILLFDEVDRFPASAGTEGDPISLGENRSKTFWNRKHIRTSTPTIEGVSRIDKSYKESDMRRYFVPCPHCEEMHLLEWKNIVWEKTDDGKDLPHTAAHACPHCGALEEDSDLPRMLKNGEWRATNPDVQGHAGFHINELYSPWVRFGKTVETFLKSKGDPERLKTWVNTALGEVWLEGKEIGNAQNMMTRRENYDADMVPYGGVVITVGVDVQDDRLEFETIAWGRNYENWSLDYTVLNGDPGRPEVWDALDTYLTRTYLHESGKRLRIMGCAIDTGGHYTKSVYAFCRPRFGRGVFAIKGASGQGKPLASSASKNNTGKVRLFTVGTETAKDMIAGHLAQEEHGPGYCHFPHHYGEGYFEQLLAEKPVVRYVRGHRVRTWQLRRTGARNEVLDCRVYALAVIDIIGIDLNGTVDRFMRIIGGNPAPGTQALMSATPRKRGYRSRGINYAGDYTRTG